jgi:hypothetical protein
MRIKQVNAMINTAKAHRVYSFKAILPQRGLGDTDRDLRLSLVSLKNSQAAIGVHIARIEKELEERKVSKYIIHPDR